MKFVRLAVIAGVLAAPMSGCADDRADAPKPVTGITTTTARRATTTSAPSSGVTPATGLSTTVPSTATPSSPPSTKPLTTAPPSQLLTEVTAAYDAAYADLLAAGAAADENMLTLDGHMDAGQAEQWRTVIRSLRDRGEHLVVASPAERWRRVESLGQPSPTVVTLNVCRFDPDTTVDSSGAVVGRDDRAFRYLETLTRKGGSWRWSGREWIDTSKDSSDCSLQ